LLRMLLVESGFKLLKLGPCVGKAKPARPVR
jgi:hypothetical protein